MNLISDLSVLAAFAHPDDETILSGGLLAMLAEKGVRVHLLSATRGEGGELGEPPITTRSDLGNVRENELRCAAEQLGARDVIFLNYVDPLVGEKEALYPFEADLETLAQEIATAHTATGANALITHGSDGEYGHPAHALMHRACKLALQFTTSSSVPLYSISADHPEHPRPRLANNSDPADFILDVEPWLSIKLKAAECHRSQAALFVRRSSREAGRQLDIAQVLMKVESLHRAWPPSASIGSDPIAQFLRSRCREALLFDRFVGHDEL